MKVSKCKIGLGLLGTYIGLTVIITLLLWAVYSIPRELLYPQIFSSIPILESEGAYPVIPLYGSKVRDNGSDACMLNVAFGTKEGKPIDNIKNALAANQPLERDEFDCLRIAITRYPGIPESVSYGRYWHGYQITLRPLLTIFDLRQIRIINYILLFGLAIVALFMLWRKLGIAYAMIMLLALLSVAFHIVPQCMHFTSVFYIGLTSMVISMLILEHKYEDILRPVLFFLSGALTSCFDLLTIPMVPLVLLLLTDSLIHTYVGTPLQQFNARMKDLVGYGIIWCIGYALFWMTKFALGSIILETNIFADAFSQASNWTDASYVSLSQWAMRALILPIKHNYLLFVCYLAILYVLVKWKKYHYAILNNAWLLIVAMIEPVWLLLMRHHTMNHYVIFVWRSEIILVLCFAIFVYRVISQTKENERVIS